MISTHNIRRLWAGLTYDHAVKMKEYHLAVKADNQAAGSLQENLEPAQPSIPSRKRKM